MTTTIKQEQKITVPVEGMTCASCVAHVEHALAEIPGVTDVAVNLANEKASLKASVGFGPEDITVEQLQGAVADVGYKIPTTKTTLNIGGMTCASCVAHVEHALAEVPGVTDAAVNLATEKATVEYVPGLAGLPDFSQAIAGSGYRVEGVEGQGMDAEAELELLSQTTESGARRRRLLCAAAGGLLLLPCTFDRVCSGAAGMALAWTVQPRSITTRPTRSGG